MSYDPHHLHRDLHRLAACYLMQGESGEKFPGVFRDVLDFWDAHDG